MLFSVIIVNGRKRMRNMFSERMFCRKYKTKGKENYGKNDCDCKPKRWSR